MALTEGKVYKALTSFATTVGGVQVIVKEGDRWLGENVPATVEKLFVAEGSTPAQELAQRATAGLDLAVKTEH